MNDQAPPRSITVARRSFLAMAGAYTLGVFNDNFYKQAVLVLAVSIGRVELQGYAAALFTLPLVVLAAPAGWLADRFPKRRVVIGAKWLELAAMLFGAVGVCLGHWPLIFVMLVIMGSQATIFSPALNGYIPELYPESYVPKANAILRMLVTAAILSGIALAGVALDCPGVGWRNIPVGQWIVAGAVLGVAVVGLAISYGVPWRPAAAPATPFPWYGPLDSVRKLWTIRRDTLLATVILADVYIWSMGSLQVLMLNPLGIQQLGLSKTLTSALIAVELAGIAVGGVVSSRLIDRIPWRPVVLAASVVFTLLLLAMALVPFLPAPWQLPAVFWLIAGVGVAGGFFLIPVESLIQIRSAAGEKGTVWATTNFAVFFGVLLSAPLANLFNTVCRPTTGFGITGLLALAATAWFWRRFRRIAITQKPEFRSQNSVF